MSADIARFMRDAGLAQGSDTDTDTDTDGGKGTGKVNLMGHSMYVLLPSHFSPVCRRYPRLPVVR